MPVEIPGAPRELAFNNLRLALGAVVTGGPGGKGIIARVACADEATARRLVLASLRPYMDHSE
jgi:hypothetical protein